MIDYIYIHTHIGIRLKELVFSANAVAVKPRSVGYLTLQSTDPNVPALFYPEFFSSPDDMIMVKDGARYLKRILEAEVRYKSEILFNQVPM